MGRIAKTRTPDQLAGFWALTRRLYIIAGQVLEAADELYTSDEIVTKWVGAIVRHIPTLREAIYGEWPEGLAALVHAAGWRCERCKRELGVPLGDGTVDLHSRQVLMSNNNRDSVTVTCRCGHVSVWRPPLDNAQNP